MTIKSLQPVKAGQPISASAMNDHRNATITQINGGPGILIAHIGNVVTATLDPAFVPRLQPMPYLVKSVEGDYVTAVPWLQDEPTGEDDESIPVNIAKPWGLRQTPFDGTTQQGLTYTYTDSETRETTDGTDTQTELVVPPYTDTYDLNIIWAMYAKTGVTANDITDDETGVVTPGQKITLIDMNLDSRYWTVPSV